MLQNLKKIQLNYLKRSITEFHGVIHSPRKKIKKENTVKLSSGVRKKYAGIVHCPR